MTIINQKSISGITSITTAAAGDNLLTVHTNDGSERLRITSNGKIGIGTASPTAPLAVMDASDPEIRFGYNETQDHRLTWDASKVFLEADPDNANGSSALGFRVDGTEAARFDSSGNFGIGEDSPTRKLVVAGDTNTVAVVRGATDGTSSLFLGDSDDEDIGALTYNHPSNYLAITVNASERMRIDSSGDAQARRARSDTAGDVALSVQPSDSTIHYGLRIDSTNNNLNLDRASGTAANLLAIDSSGNLGLGGITSPTWASDGGIHLGDDYGIGFGDGGSGRPDFQLITAGDGRLDLRCGFGSDDADISINSSGRLLVGTTSTRAVGGVTAKFEVEGTGSDSSISLIRNSNNSANPYLLLAKSRGTSVGSNTSVNDDDYLGAIYFAGADGTDLANIAAEILCRVDGTPGSNDIPGRLEFKTSSGSGTTTRMTISDVGKFTAPTIYSITTTGGGPVYVEADGDLLRYTSSLKYKTDVETIEDARADAILNCRPVWYRSKCDNDIKTEGSEKSDWGWYGFIAEEVAEIEPRLVNWATKDGIRQEDGSVESVERDPADYEAEGVRYDNFIPLLVNLAKRQKAQIDALEARIAALEG